MADIDSVFDSVSVVERLWEIVMVVLAVSERDRVFSFDCVCPVTLLSGLMDCDRDAVCEVVRVMVMVNEDVRLPRVRVVLTESCIVAEREREAPDLVIVMDDVSD